MNILFYTPVKLLYGGGCERWHCDVANSLRKQFGFKIKIVSGNLGDNKWSKKYLQEQLNGTDYTQLNYISFMGILIPTPSIFFFLLKKVREADAVYFIYGFAGQDILLTILKLLTGKTIIVGHHAPIFHSNKFHNLYMKFVSRHLLNFFDGHQALNKQDKELLEKKWAIKNVFFIPAGVRTEKFLRVKRKPHKKLTFISVGRYEIQKGYDLLLEAIEKFNQQFPNNNAQFFFVGDGSLKSLIGKYAKKHKNIIDFGYVLYEKLPEIYSKSDVYLLSSREEPFGLVIVEAWAVGLPVLATKAEGPNDMLKPEVNGWFIEEITADSIYKSIAKIYQKYLKNKNYFLQFEKACKETGKLYSIDTTAKIMKETFFTTFSSQTYTSYEDAKERR